MSKIYMVSSPEVRQEQFASVVVVSAQCPPSEKSKHWLYVVCGACEKLRSAVGSLCCESAVVTLTLVSVLAISGEILVDYGILTVPANKGDDHPTPTTSPQVNSTPAPTDRSHTSSSEEDETMEVVQKVFHYTSFVIACLFFLEIVVKMSVFRRKFFVKRWQVLDMLIVVATLLVEIAFEVEERMPELEACTFIVIFRLWRLPYACAIKAEDVQRDMQQDIEVWKAGTRKMEDKCNTLEAKSNKQKEKIGRLEQELLTLKKEMKESHRNPKHHPGSVSSLANGSVPHDTVDGMLPNHRPPSELPHNNTGNVMQNTRHYWDEGGTPTMDGILRSTQRREDDDDDDRDTEEDTVDEDDSRAEQRSRDHFRSGSESSVSCQALEQEVHVQIEGQDEAEGKVSSLGLPPSADGQNSGVNTPVNMRRKIVWSDSKNGWTAEPVVGSEMYFDNSGYIPDLEEGEDEHRGELMHELDGTRTYRSAEGIPMTDL